MRVSLQLKRQRVIDIQSIGSEIDKIPMRKIFAIATPTLTVESEKIKTMKEDGGNDEEEKEGGNAIKSDSSGGGSSNSSSSSSSIVRKDKTTVTRERDVYYTKFIDEYDDDFGMVGFIFERRREQRNHVRGVFPPLPSTLLLRELGLGNSRRLHEQHEPTGMNAIHACCACGDDVILSLLLEYDAPPHGTRQLDLQCPSSFGSTPLQLAVAEKHSGCIQLLLYEKNGKGRGININWRNSTVNATALMLSCNQCDLPVVRSLLTLPHRGDTRLTDRYMKTALMYACEHNTDAAVAIIGEILSAETTFPARKSLLESTDACKWSPLHYAARSGVLARFPWDLLGGEIHALNVLGTDAVTEIGVSLIHIAAWNGHDDVLRLLLTHGSVPLSDLGYHDASDDNGGVATKFIPNHLTRTKRMTELDLALMAHHMSPARTLCRIKFPYAGKRGGYMTSKMGGSACQHLLERAALGCDIEAVEGILRWDQNKVRITRPLVEMTRKMVYVDTCTFTFAAYNSPMKQPIWHCGHCNVKACVVCRYTCHSSPECVKRLVWKGDDKDEYCECSINTGHCSALKNAGKRNLGYLPKPADTDGVEVPEELVQLAEMVAINIHEVWSVGLIEKGWRYHPKRNNEALMHNCLVPYWELEEQDKKYDKETAFGSIRLVLALGYTMTRREDEGKGGEGDMYQKRREAIAMMMQDSDGSGSAGERRRARRRVNKMEALREEGGGGGTAVAAVAVAGDSDGEGAMALKKEEEEEEEEEEGGEYVTYQPHPLDTSNMDMTPEVTDLLEIAAKNCHELWAQSKMKAGFRHASEEAMKKAEVLYEMEKKREEKRRKNSGGGGGEKEIAKPMLSSLLVPYDDLLEEDKEKNRDTVRATLLTSMFLGFIFEPPVHDIDFGSLSRVDSTLNHSSLSALPTSELRTTTSRIIPSDDEETSPLQESPSTEIEVRRNDDEEDMEHYERKRTIERFKSKLLEFYLHSSARSNDSDMIDLLVRADEGQGASVNAKDQFEHYPLYMAVKVRNLLFCIFFFGICVSQNVEP